MRKSSMAVIDPRPVGGCAGRSAQASAIFQPVPPSRRHWGGRSIFDAVFINRLDRLPRLRSVGEYQFRPRGRSCDQAIIQVVVRGCTLPAHGAAARRQTALRERRQKARA